MGKYRDLIDQVSSSRTAREALVDADGRALPALVHALLHHHDDAVRENVAEILGERRSAKAIPHLIEALEDDCLYVRQDVLWSIEQLALMQPAALTFWLDLNCSNGSEMKHRVKQWWQVNRQFVDGNPGLA